MSQEKAVINGKEFVIEKTIENALILGVEAWSRKDNKDKKFFIIRLGRKLPNKGVFAIGSQEVLDGIADKAGIDKELLDKSPNLLANSNTRISADIVFVPKGTKFDKDSTPTKEDRYRLADIEFHYDYLAMLNITDRLQKSRNLSRTVQLKDAQIEAIQNNVRKANTVPVSEQEVEDIDLGGMNI